MSGTDCNDQSHCECVDSLYARIKELEVALLEAANDIEDWGQYAGDYFMEKHGLDDDVAKYRRIANREAGE